MLIINKHFNYCCFRALVYTTLDRLCAVFLYNLYLTRANDYDSVVFIMTTIEKHCLIWGVDGLWAADHEGVRVPHAV